MNSSGAKVKTQVRREQIVQAALRIIAEKGAQSLTTAALAKQAGISEANLYRHFKNKEEILSETVRKISEGLKNNQQKVLSTGKNNPPLEKLRKAFMLHLDYIEKNEGIPRLVFSDEIHAGNKALKQKLLEAIDSYSKNIEALIKEAQKAGFVKQDINPGTCALMLIGLIQTTILRWSLSGFSYSLVAAGRKLWDTFLKCITAE